MTILQRSVRLTRHQQTVLFIKRPTKYKIKLRHVAGHSTGTKVTCFLLHPPSAEQEQNLNHDNQTRSSETMKRFIQ